MDDRHLGLTSSGHSDVQHLNHPLNNSYEMNQTTMLESLQENNLQERMNFPPEMMSVKYPLSRWVGDIGPWHPRGLTSHTEDISGQSMLSGIRDGQFMTPLPSNVVPSEIMPQSDSGYGSYNNHHSIADGSVCDDNYGADIDTQSIIGGPIDATSKNAMVLGGSWASSISPIRIETMKCDGCGKVVKTKSELKKHDQRHKKPFKCDIEDCSRRIEGFSTPNDLDRHKRSVHPESQTSGNRYICQIGPCRNKHKIWPRADNFKAHLKRVHNTTNITDEDLEGYVYKQPISSDESRDTPRQEALSDYNGFSGLVNEQTNSWPTYLEGPHGMNSLRSLGEAQAEDTLSLPSSPPGSTDLHTNYAAPRLELELFREATEHGPTPHKPIALSSRMQHDRLSRESEVFESIISPTQQQMVQVARDYSTETQVADMDVSRSGISDEPSELGSTNSPVHSVSEHLVKTDSRASGSVEPEEFPAQNTGSLDLDFDDETTVRRLIDELDSRGALERHGYKKDNSETAELAKSEDGLVISQNSCHACGTCGKSFPRRCELKKHEKRHEKPYGCTMPECAKKFGSKNDWKRHENTQHFMLEMWKCDEEECEKICYRRENFRTHLEKDHHIIDQPTLEPKFEKCRVGRNCEARFWCGFCEKIIEIKQKGHQAWAERFDHIGEHFSSRNPKQKDISQWQNFDPSWRSKELLRDDSDEGDDFLSSTESVRAQNSRQDEIQHSLIHSKSKRKREDGNSFGNSKKNRVAGSQGLVCCRCGDLVTVSQLRCNFPCEHIPCDNCRP
ncbi:hypothetical protein F5Y14DRAFT_442755 [Nemania sp. NC0429]|nr:hypothetical protein F5Y14DRAFT_442755 [Nemania sp. NC0429]